MKLFLFLLFFGKNVFAVVSVQRAIVILQPDQTGTIFSKAVVRSAMKDNSNNAIGRTPVGLTLSKEGLACAQMVFGEALTAAQTKASSLQTVTPRTHFVPKQKPINSPIPGKIN